MWSRLISANCREMNSVEIIAREMYDLNHCEYHNWQHILDCYKYLEDDDVSYDIDLDWAVMHHDIIYDKNPAKERRSADFLLDNYTGCTFSANIIMSTEKHKLNKESTWQEHRMVMADLHQLCDPVRTTENYVKIMNESMWLYGITPLEFAENNCIFMSNLLDTIFGNMNIVEEHYKFWNDVRRGVEHTINISKSIKKEFEVYI